MRRAAQIAAHIFAERGTLTPMWIGERRDGSEFFFDSHFLTRMPIDVFDAPESKTALMALVRVILKRERVVIYAQAMEAWMVRQEQTPGDPPPPEWSGPEGIRHHPDRFEVLMFYAGDRHHNLASAVQSIIRPAGEAAYLDDDFTVHGGDYTVKGRMTDLLGRPTTRNERDAVRRATEFCDMMGRPHFEGHKPPVPRAEPQSVFIVAQRHRPAKRAKLMMDIPADKNFPLDAAQCDNCGGWGCKLCGERGWVAADHALARKCERIDCPNLIPPAHVAVYCSTNCAMLDA